MEDFFANYQDIDYNKITKTLNDLFEFRKQFMPNESMIDVIVEFSNKNDFNPVQLAQELGEIKGFQDIMMSDCSKFKFTKDKQTIIASDWE